MEKAKDFRELRIPKYFKHFEAVLSSNKEKGNEWLVESEISYADLALYYLVDGVRRVCPTIRQSILMLL